MKGIVRNICAWLIRQGADKWLHLVVGLVLCEMLMLVPVRIPYRMLLSLSCVTMLELFKECVIDDFFNAKDLMFTVIGEVIGISISLLTILI